MMALLFVATEVKAQVNLSAEVMSRYVWRGADFGSSPSIQPDINVALGNFEIGAWAAFSTIGHPDGTEIDWYAAYHFDLNDAGSISLMLTDYTFPEDTGFFNSDAHFLEAGIEYGGTETFPVSMFAGIFLTNDDDTSVYLELGYDTGPFDLFLGMTPAESALYGTTGAGVINAGLGTTKELSITDQFSVDLTGSVMANPYNESMFFVFGIGF